MKTSQAINTSQLPVQVQKRARIYALLCIVLIITLVIVGELAIHLYTRSGWTALNVSIAALAVDSQGRIWVVDTNDRVWVAEGTRLVPPSGESIEIPLSGDEVIKCLAIDKQGQLWVGTSERNVILYNLNKKWITYTPRITVDHYGSQEIEELAVDGLNRVWVRSTRELGVFDPGKGDSSYSVQVSSGIPFTIDDQGQVWVIEKWEVKVLGSDGKWKSYGEIKVAEYGYGEDLVVDRLGRVWLGALKDEVSILDSDNALTTTYAVDDDPRRYASPRFLVFDTQDRLWGTSVGLFMLDADGNLNLYNRMFSGFPDGAVHALVLDGQGRAWIHSHPDRLTVFNIKKSYPLMDPGTIRFTNIVILISIPSIVLGLAWILAGKYQAAINFISVRDFYVGLLGWFGLWTLIAFGVGLIPFGGPGAYAVAQLCLGVLLVPTVIGLIILFRKRSWIIVGGAAAFVINAIGWLLKYSSLIFSSPIGNIFLMIPYF
jgi:streptogramin lyase